MSDWAAHTESGAVYIKERGFVSITPGKDSRNPRTVIKVWHIKSANVDEDDVKLGLPWAEPDQWDSVEIPVIGRRLYVSGKDEWRISTPIVSVTPL